MSPTYSSSESPRMVTSMPEWLGAWTNLAAWCLVLSVIWLGLLPRLMDLPPLRREIETLEEQGIDPSAMFYTELDTMDEVRRRLTETHDEHSDAFWRP